MTDRGPVTRCRIRACPFVGHFAAYDDLCPAHRDDDVADRLPVFDVTLDLDQPDPEGT